ncbi:MAG: TonB-dependent receptor plug domain-containing protein, partial [Sphingomonadaceae bacterium]
ETLLAGSPSSYPLNACQSPAHTGGLRSTLNWGQRLDADGQLSVRIGVDHSRRRSDYRFDGATTDGTPRLRRAVTAAADDSSLTSSGKYARSWLQQHRFALGWDGASTRRSESRQQDDTALPGPGASQLLQQYQARVERIAVFAQDEWEAGAGLQTYAGLRWEGLSTRTSGAALAAVSNQSGVWSPVAQLVWQLPGRPREQLRLALARTYKAPPTRDLLPRRYTVNNGNSPTNPDQQGNPELRPELAWGLDGAYEWYPAPQASASLSAYLRRIHDVTLQRLFEQDGHWVSSPANLGGARVAGLEFDTRLPLQALLATAPALELRLNAARNWSQLDAVAGPDNRLAAQLPASANIGLDYRPTAAWTLGLHASLQRGGKLRLSAQRSSDSSTQRTLDLFASWKPSPRSQLRIALLNLFPQARQQGQFYADGMASWSSVSTTPSQRGLRFVLDQSL